MEGKVQPPHTAAAVAEEEVEEAGEGNGILLEKIFASGEVMR